MESLIQNKLKSLCPLFDKIPCRLLAFDTSYNNIRCVKARVKASVFVTKDQDRHSLALLVIR